MTKIKTEARLIEVSANSLNATFSKSLANEGSKQDALLWVLDEWCEVLEEIGAYVKTFSSEKRKLALAEIFDCFILADMHKVHLAEIITLLPAYNNYRITFEVTGNNLTLEKNYEMKDSCYHTKAVMQLLSDTSDDTLKNIYAYWRLKSIARGRDAWTEYSADRAISMIRVRANFITKALK